MNKLLTLVLALAVALFSTGRAQHHDEDLVPGYDDDDYLVMIEPHEIAEPPYVLRVLWEEVMPGIYIADVGFTLHHEGELPMLARVSFVQTDVSPGLFGVVEGEIDPIFGLGTPGILSLSLPYRGHLHVTFTAPDNSIRFLRFCLTDGVAYDDGRALHDSLITYELRFVPEPATLLVLAAGLGWLVIKRRMEA